MKNINLIKHLKNKIKITQANSNLARSKNDWDPIKLYPYNPVDEHVEPLEEDIIKEIFDKNYYHFGWNAKLSDHHDAKDMFHEYRQWQHLYNHPR